MKTFKVCAYIRDGRGQVATDVDIKASRLEVAAQRGAKEAIAFAKASGIKRPKMLELRISVIKSTAGDVSGGTDEPR